MTLDGETLVPGTVTADVFALAEPVSFWGGFDSGSGKIIDHRHPDLGQVLSGRIVLITAARGSSSGSSVLAEAIRIGTAPAAFIVAERDAILTVGAMVAAELYDRHCPIVLVALNELRRLSPYRRLVVRATASGATISTRDTT